MSMDQLFKIVCTFLTLRSCLLGQIWPFKLVNVPLTYLYVANQALSALSFRHYKEIHCKVIVWPKFVNFFPTSLRN